MSMQVKFTNCQYVPLPRKPDAPKGWAKIEFLGGSMMVEAPLGFKDKIENCREIVCSAGLMRDSIRLEEVESIVGKDGRDLMATDLPSKKAAS